MYLYIDESGHPKWPSNERFMVFAVLVIEGGKPREAKRSKHTISVETCRALLDLKKHRQPYKRGQREWLDELKGTKLREHPDVRLRFFKRIVRRAQFQIYLLEADKSKLRQPISGNPGRRYSMFLRNIFIALHIPTNQRWVTMVIDSQASFDPRRKELDQQRRLQLNNGIQSLFKKCIKQKGTHLAINHARSDKDRCLQAADVISNFFHRKLELDQEWAALKELRRSQPMEKQLVRKWQRLYKERNDWFEACEVLKPNITFVRAPKVLLVKKLGKLRSKSRTMKLNGGQP